MAWRWILLALLAALGSAPADAASKSGKKDKSITCEQPGEDGVPKFQFRSKKSAAKDDDDDKDDDEDDEGVRFPFAGGCAKVTGGVSYTYQQAQQSGARIPVFINKNGTVSRGTSSNTASADIGWQTSRQTALGDFKTSADANWSKATDDGTTNGTVQVTGWSVGLDGLTVGYIGTLMSFWEGDFLTTANAPGRTANMVSYEYKINDQHTIAAAIESNLPTTPQTLSGIQSFNFSDPVYTLRWRYEHDDVTLHLSGVLRRADFSQSPLAPFFPDTAAVRTGWGVSAGVKVPVKFIGEDDEFNTQWTYTSDAASYLGIGVDLTMYQHTIRSTSPTTGWSAVAGYKHVWSEQFESNAFASFVKLEANLLLASPVARSLRTGVNLFWKPIDHLKFGVEFGTVEMRIDANGIRGLFDGVSGRAYIGMFSVSAEL